MSEIINKGDKYIVLTDFLKFGKNQIVTIDEFKNLNNESFRVIFKEDDKNTWFLPDESNFKKIEENRITEIEPVEETQYIKISGRIERKFDQYAEFDKIVQSATTIYRQKNADYGDSFAKSIQKRGFVAALTRIEDKFQRFDNIVSTGKVEVKNESLEDTLLDMANYAIMTAIEIRRKKFEENK